MLAKLRSTLFEDITSQGFCAQPVHPDFLGQRLPHILQGMQRITEHPKEQKYFPWQTLPADLYGQDQAIEYGLRLPEAGKPPKYVFHYVCGIESLLEGWVPQNQYKPFLWALHGVATWSHKLAIAAAAQFDQNNRGVYSGSLAERLQQGQVVVRVLRYKHTQDTCAQTHFDRSLLTLHLHASHPGLVLFGPDNTPHEFPETAHGPVAIFPGAKFIGATGGAYGPLTPHGVRASEASDDRYALVSFIHPKAVEGDVKIWRDIQPCLRDTAARLAV
jgi:hypothetical protein